MRVLRLVDPDRYAVEFHPYITVVAEATAEHREAIVTAFEQAAAGRSTVLRGLIEVHGVVLDLDDRALGLLDLDVDDIEICVTAEDLPGSSSADVGRQVREAEARLEALEQPHRDRRMALEAAETELAMALAAEEAAAAGPAATDAAVEDDEREALVARRAELQLERDRLFAALDPGASIAMDEALAALEAATAQHEGDGGVAEGPVDSESDSDSLTDEERLGDLRAALSLHRLYDPAPVREALDDVRAGRSAGEMSPSTEALSLVDRLDALDREIAALDADVELAPGPAEVEAAEDRVEQARLRLLECERSLDAQGGGEDDIRLLEEAHAAVERARESLEGRFGKGRAQARLDEALSAESEILGRLGLGSYTEFLTLGGSAAPGQRPTREVDAARADVAAAEADLARLTSGVQASLTQAELVEDRRRARDQARELLGEPDLPDEAIAVGLLRLRVPADESGATDTLVDVLDSVGLSVRGLEIPPAEVEAMAADWLAEYQHTETRLTLAIEALEDGVSPPPVTVPEATEDAFHLDDPVTDARAAVESAKARMIAHEAASAALTEIEASLDALEATLAEGPAAGDAAEPADAAAETAAAVASARAAIAELSEAIEQASPEYDRAVEELAVVRQTMAEVAPEPPPVSEIEWYLLARLAAQRQQSFVGSLPLVITGALDQVDDDEGLEHLLDRLERMAGAVQIVHITDDPRIIGWADALDDDRAAVVRPMSAIVGDS
ncbi:hypothetical protein [Actinospongicola halichondriae]|uniref:hypothetical protein n=1 Tax=Actinospongicola halichondriae TaxID=3236844 RepID=UPI003D57FBD3